ncbi:hypothetical protein F2P81_000937 [Scophthalmus maximus]|uniref:SH2 domain-containing protein n=1 Tax=Scophthalmus maximus TaxID=52904 RepID=A0A6A4TVY0_SCOMX|nr:hypothetical protein F2P81_000937 [Scophthalmus maximus]
MEQEGMLVQSVYYGRIGSEATERLLERFGRDGSFLLRDSDTMQGAYCLCVSCEMSFVTHELLARLSHSSSCFLCRVCLHGNEQQQQRLCHLRLGLWSGRPTLLIRWTD